MHDKWLFREHVLDTQDLIKELELLLGVSLVDFGYDDAVELKRKDGLECGVWTYLLDMLKPIDNKRLQCQTIKNLVVVDVNLFEAAYAFDFA